MKEKIKAEIERRLRTIEPNLPSREEFDKVADRNPGINSDFNIGEKMGAYTMLKKIEQFINSLEEEPVSNDLEEAAWAYYDKNKPLIPHVLDLHREMISFFIAGAQWQKKNLWKDAVEAVIHPYDGEIWVNKDLLSIYDDCQRVKLIIEEE